MAVQREQVVQTAEKYVSRGKIEPAIREYRKLLADNPNDINTLNRIGDLYARIQRIDEAVDFFTQIAEQYSTGGFLRQGDRDLQEDHQARPDAAGGLREARRALPPAGAGQRGAHPVPGARRLLPEARQRGVGDRHLPEDGGPRAEQPELPRQARRDLPVAAADREGDERVPRDRRDDDRPRPPAGRGPGLRAGAGHRQQQHRLHQRRRLQAQGVGQRRRGGALPGDRHRAQPAGGAHRAPGAR